MVRQDIKNNSPQTDADRTIGIPPSNRSTQLQPPTTIVSTPGPVVAETRESSSSSGPETTTPASLGATNLDSKPTPKQEADKDLDKQETKQEADEETKKAPIKQQETKPLYIVPDLKEFKKEISLLLVDEIKTCLNPVTRASVVDCDKSEKIRPGDEFLSTFRQVMEMGQKSFEKLDGRLNKVETLVNQQSPQTTKASAQDQTNYPLVVKSEPIVNQLALQPQQPHYSSESQQPVNHPLVPISTPQFMNHSGLPPQLQSRSSESQVTHVAPLQHLFNPLVPKSTPQFMDQLAQQPHYQPHSSSYIYRQEPSHFANQSSLPDQQSMNQSFMNQQQSMNQSFSANQFAVMPVQSSLFQGPVQTPQTQNIQGISLHNPPAGSSPSLSFYGMNNRYH